MHDLNNTFSIIIVSIIMSIALSSCHNTPKGVLSEKKMTELLIDLHKAEALSEIKYRDFPNDSAKLQLKQAVYNLHQTDQATFDSSLRWYGYHVDKLSEVYDNVIKELEAEVEKAGSVAVLSTSIMGDSVNAWTGASSYVFNRLSPVNRLDFTLKKDNAWEKGDSYTFQFKTLNKANPGNVAIFIDYDNNTTDYVSHSIEDDSWTRLTAVMDTLRNPVSVYGFVSFDMNQNEEIFVDSLSLVRRRFDTSSYRRRYNQQQFNFKSEKR
ncbi:MAG: DUF4296 domain-containing protein [Muribaculaceae bacterium]|nr:DUF4296 domain-containing protein [Muribaculaceae bacterium]